MSLTGKVYVCGDEIPDIRILDLTTLEEIDRIPTETNKLRRLVSFDSDNSETNLFVVGGYHRDDFVSLFDFETKVCLGQINDVVGIRGLESVSSSSLSSNPIIVCGGGYGRKVSAYDFFSENVNKCLAEFENPPTTRRICCFPKWSMNEVFVGGSDYPNGDALYRYDVNQGGVRLGSYVGHVGSEHSDVYAITASLSDGILISGSIDRYNRKGATLKLWSKDNYECIESVSLHECHSLSYSSENHLVCCGTKKEIEIWDIRNMSKRVRKVTNVGDDRVRDLDQIPSLYSSSLSNDSLFVSGSGKFVSMWNPNTGRGIQKCELDDVDRRSYVCGLRILPLESQVNSPSSPSTDEASLSVIHQFENLCDFQLRCDASSYELPVPRSLLSSSPYLTTETNSLSLDRSYDLVDEERFFSVLFGMDPSPETLSQFYSLFRELHMFGFAYSICELIHSTVTEGHVEGLVADSSFTVEKSTNLDSEIHSLFAPFELELLRHIHDLKSSDRLSTDVWNRLKRTRPDAMVALMDVELLPSFRDHSEFRGLVSNSTSKSVAEASKRNLSSLLTLRKFTNVTLTTNDGGEEHCHLEVLIARSNFFRQMMHFTSGVEYHSYLETKTIRVEDLSHAALQWWLVLCYGSEFHEMDQFSVYDLLSLLVKSHMHQESWCRRIIDLLDQEIEKRESGEIHPLLLEIGSQLLNLPRLYQDRIKGFLRRLSGTGIGFDEVYEIAMKYSQKLQEAAFEAERLSWLAEEVPLEGEEDDLNIV